MQVYLHSNLKERYPVVIEKIHKAYPSLYEYQEISQECWAYARNTRFADLDDEGVPYDLKTNEYGFLSPDNPPKNEKQLIVIGDSFVATRSREPIPWVLKRKLHIPVFSMGAPVWGPANYRDAFLNWGKGRNSKTVAVFSYENDINDAMVYKKWKDSKSTLPLLKYLAVYQWIGDSFVDKINIHESFLDRHSLLFNSLRYAFSRPPRRLKAPVVQLGSGEVNEEIELANKKKVLVSLNPNAGHAYLSENPEEFLSGGSQHEQFMPYFDQLKKLNQEIEADGKKMILFFIPSKERVYLSHLKPEQRKKYIFNSSQRIDGYDRALKQFAEAEKIKLILLAPELTRRASMGPSLYFKDDIHTNSHGDAAIGEIAAEVLHQLL